MVAFYNPADQELYKTYQYLPQEKYRLGLNLPKTEQDISSVTASFGIPATNAFTGGGDNFSVYNADPNTITNMNPNKYALQDARYANELSYVGKKNQPDTFKPTGKTVTKYKPFIGPDKVTIPGQGANTLKEAERFVADYFKKNPKTIRVRDPQKDYASKDERRKFEKLKQGRMIKFGAGKGYTVHHMLPLAGKADVTTSDLAKISAKMNTELSQFDKPMNKLVNEAYALDFSKTESLKRMDEINKELADYVKKSVKKIRTRI